MFVIGFAMRSSAFIVPLLLLFVCNYIGGTVGCAQVSTEIYRKDMGSSMSLFWGSANDNVLDPATGLTGRQKKLVQNMWAIVRKEPIPNGVAIMIA